MPLDSTQLALLAAMIFLAALLYASVGHAGASGYLAAMALLGIAPEVMKPAALAMNVLVAAIATYRFGSTPYFKPQLLWPFAVGSVPLAFVGGAMQLPFSSYRVLVGVSLLVSAAWMAWRINRPEPLARPPKLAAAVAIGAGLGLLSGLTGVGGGIFLSPLLLLAGWAGTRETAAASAPFILVNSISGLLGHWSSIGKLPPELGVLAAVAVLGGAIGAQLGSRHLPPKILRALLSIVLVIAGVKLVAVAFGRG